MQLLKKIVKSIINIIVSLASIIKLVYVYKQKKEPLCLLISNGSTLSGAPLVLLEAAKIFKSHGYSVIILSEYLGPFNDECQKCGLTMIVASAFKDKFIIILKKINFKFIWVNTIVYYNWVTTFEDGKAPVYWWIHEGKTYIDDVKMNLPKKLCNNVHVFYVSSWTEHAMKAGGISYKYSMLSYGCTDMYDGSNILEDNYYIRVALVGNICERKNQIYLMDTIKKLSKNVKDQYKFIIVGRPLSDHDPYYMEFKKRLDSSSMNIKYIPSIPRAKMAEFYNDIDMVLCCSNDDPLPVVITEGMMFKKVVATSVCTGQFDLIEHGVNGFNFTFDKEENLQLLLEEIVLHKESLCNVADMGRKTYEEKFQPNVFERNLINIVS